MPGCNSVYPFHKINTHIPENKTGSYINFCSKKHIRAYFQGVFYFFMYNHLHLFKYSHVIFFRLLRNAAQWCRVEFHLIGAYF